MSLDTDHKTNREAGRGKARSAAAMLGIIALVIAACFLGRTLVQAITPQVWKITQFPSTQDNQIMFYTIEDNKGHFVIIDGGLWQDAEIVWGEILKHKRHIDAWIVTHPHPDHTDAFNNLMQSPPLEFTVDTIYLPEVNPETYEEKQKPWDNIGSYYLQAELTEGLDNITYVHENDEFDLIGLDMKVISSWDENVDALPQQLPNDGSIMFKISGSEQSMLFCSDVEEDMEQYIIPAHEQELRADYVQCAHHGNWGLSNGFYDYVHASVAFMDAPEWVFDPEKDYTALQLKEYLEERGTAVYTFENAPHTIELR